VTVDSFKLVREAEIPELASSARAFIHEATGAEILTLANGDAIKCFGITFRTPLSDSTGVAHILEHSVLCGSRHFPSAAPFAELLKGSLHTHLNASTLPDMTTYMAASQNERDFYNLFEVYLDAVFHPLLRESTFRQEAWHIIPEKGGKPAHFGGVVLNEMKGVYADPAAVLVKELRTALFPDTSYRFDHGGDPALIPTLAHEALQRFHSKYYHPSNAIVFLSGDLDMQQALAFLQRHLDGWGLGTPAGVSSRQVSFATPRLVRRSIGSGGPGGHVIRGWVLPDPSDPFEALEQLFLAELLLGSDAAPLRRAVIESGLGEGLIGDGLSRETRQPIFSIGLSGVAARDAIRFDQLVDEVITELIRKGPPRALVEACLNRLAFRLRENDGGRHPPGLALMLRILGPWRSGHDPIDFLAFETPLAALREKMEADAHLRERLRILFGENLHRATVTLSPDPTLEAREKAAERSRLQALLATYVHLSTADEHTGIANVPVLGLDELPREETPTPCEIMRQDHPCVLLHPLPTNGICYLQLGFRLDTLPATLLPLAPLFGRALLECGTERDSAEDLALRMARFVGGVSVEQRAFACQTSSQAQAWLFLRFRGMKENLGAILAILTDILTAARFDDRNRFMALLQDEISRHRARLIPRGHEYADLALSAALHPAGAFAEVLNGVSQLRFLQRLCERAETDWESVLADLERLRRLLIRREGAICDVTVEPAAADGVAAAVLAFLEHLSDGRTSQRGSLPPALSGSMGLPIEAPVNFVGQGLKLPEEAAQVGAHAAATRYIAGTWLWDQVRMQGGAYGALVRLDPLSGGLRFLSYRDPNLLRTLDIFDAVPRFLRESVHEDDIRRSIISAFGEIDRPRLPGERGFEAMLARLAGDTCERRQERRDRLLATTRADFLKLADLIEAREKRVAVLGSEAALNAALQERPGAFNLSQAV